MCMTTTSTSLCTFTCHSTHKSACTLCTCTSTCASTCISTMSYVVYVYTHTHLVPHNASAIWFEIKYSSLTSLEYTGRLPQKVDWMTQENPGTGKEIFALKLTNHEWRALDIMRMMLTLTSQFTCTTESVQSHLTICTTQRHSSCSTPVHSNLSAAHVIIHTWRDRASVLLRILPRLPTTA